MKMATSRCEIDKLALALLFVLANLTKSWAHLTMSAWIKLKFVMCHVSNLFYWSDFQYISTFVRLEMSLCALSQLIKEVALSNSFTALGPKKLGTPSLYC